MIVTFVRSKTNIQNVQIGRKIDEKMLIFKVSTVSFAIQFKIVIRTEVVLQRTNTEIIEKHVQSVYIRIRFTNTCVIS